MSKRRTHSPEFKARVAMEAISGRKTIQEIGADHAIHPRRRGATPPPPSPREWTSLLDDWA